MADKVPLYVVGLPKDEPVSVLLMSKFSSFLEKIRRVLSDIIEAKISIRSQNPDGTRTHYDVTATVVTSKNRLLYPESGWDVIKITDGLCGKLEGELSKHDENRQKESIRKKESH